MIFKILNTSTLIIKNFKLVLKIVLKGMRKGPVFNSDDPNFRLIGGQVEIIGLICLASSKLNIDTIGEF